MNLIEANAIIGRILARVAPERSLTRITVMVDTLILEHASNWYRVALGYGAIGVTDFISPDRLTDDEDTQMFIERLLVRLDHALAESADHTETSTDSAQ